MVCRFKIGCTVIEVPVRTKFVSAAITIYYLSMALSQFPWPCLIGFSAMDSIVGAVLLD